MCDSQWLWTRARRTLYVQNPSGYALSELTMISHAVKAPIGSLGTASSLSSTCGMMLDDEHDDSCADNADNEQVCTARRVRSSEGS